MSMPIKITDEVSVFHGGSPTPPQEALSVPDIVDGEQVALGDEGTTARLDNPVVVAMKKLQRGLAGEAERLGIASDKDAMTVVKELRGDY